MVIFAELQTAWIMHPLRAADGHLNIFYRKAFLVDMQLNKKRSCWRAVNNNRLSRYLSSISSARSILSVIAFVLLVLSGLNPAWGTLHDFPLRLTAATVPGVLVPGQSVSVTQVSASIRKNSVSNHYMWVVQRGRFNRTPVPSGPATKTSDPRCLGDDCSWTLDISNLQITGGFGLSGTDNISFSYGVFPWSTGGTNMSAYTTKMSSNVSLISGISGGNIRVIRSAIGSGALLSSETTRVFYFNICSVEAPNNSWDTYCGNNVLGPSAQNTHWNMPNSVTITVPAMTRAGPVCTLFPWSPSSVDLGSTTTPPPVWTTASGSAFVPFGAVQRTSVSISCAGSSGGTVPVTISYTSTGWADGGTLGGEAVLAFSGNPRLGVRVGWESQSNALTSLPAACSGFTIPGGSNPPTPDVTGTHSTLPAGTLTCNWSPTLRSDGTLQASTTAILQGVARTGDDSMSAAATGRVTGTIVYSITVQ